MKTFDFISDPGHAWLKVPVSLLIELGIDQEITCYSYYRDGFAYLEEDLDAGTFMQAMKKAGREFKFRERIARQRHSRVREYTCYTKHVANNIRQENLKTAILENVPGAKALHDSGRLIII